MNRFLREIGKPNFLELTAAVGWTVLKITEYWCGRSSGQFLLLYFKNLRYVTKAGKKWGRYTKIRYSKSTFFPYF